MNRIVTLGVLVLIFEALSAGILLHAQDRASVSSQIALTLIQRPEIQQELGLNEAQIREIERRDSTPEYVEERFSRGRSREATVSKARATLIQRDVDLDLSAILNVDQQKRMKQLELQYMSRTALGTFLLSDSELADALKLTDQQKKELRQIVEADIRAARGLRLRSRDLDAARYQLSALLAGQEKEVIESVLNEEQKSELIRRKGNPSQAISDRFRDHIRNE